MNKKLFSILAVFFVAFINCSSVYAKFDEKNEINGNQKSKNIDYDNLIKNIELKGSKMRFKVGQLFADKLEIGILVNNGREPAIHNIVRKNFSLSLFKLGIAETILELKILKNELNKEENMYE